jgi:hypothetical protein
VPITLEQVAGEIRSLRDEIRELAETVLVTARGDQVPLLMSQVAFARLLRISASRTLRPAIQSGKIRAVRVGKRLMIPATEMLRMQRRGLDGVHPVRISRPREPRSVQDRQEPLEELLARRAAALKDF